MVAVGGGTVIGGSYQKGVWESQPDPNMTMRIMKRAVELCPELVKPGEGVEGLDVIRTYAGLRPYRNGGVRLEKEVIDGVTVVHNYGAGGFGCKCILISQTCNSLTTIRPGKLWNGRTRRPPCRRGFEPPGSSLIDLILRSCLEKGIAINLFSNSSSCL